jgi:serine/threonine protein kinase
MPTASPPSLADALRQYRLLEPEQLDEVTRHLQGRFPDPKALARELIGRGWLTPYQANQVLQGKGHELLLGSYVLLERLGEGGMGAVFKARNWKLGRVVALKLIRKERMARPEAVRRFQREVRAAAALSHPNIVMAHDADTVGGTHLLVMEYLEGATDLARLVRARGPLRIAVACEVVRQAALGLQHAHEKGLVHRDIKPHNLLLTAGGAQVKILDMGLALLSNPCADEDSGTVTQLGTVVGTVDYLAPEQARRAHTVDIRADIYSLGCTFYFLLTARVPFPEEAFTEKLLRHQFDDPTPAEQLRPEVPQAVSAIVRKMMAKKPEDRYQTPAEVAQALARMHNGPEEPTLPAPSSGPLEETPPAPASADTGELLLGGVVPSGDTREEATLLRRTKPRRTRGLLYAAIAGGCVLLGALLALAFLRKPGANEAEPAPPRASPLARKPPREQPSRRPPEVFEDFESGTYGQWKATGNAFGKRPATGAFLWQGRVTGFGGKYLVNSFHGGDWSTGTLTSPEFTIRRPYIQFRVGGGKHPGKACINLLIDGRVVRSATGKNRERLEWASWEVKAFRGYKGTIEIVDFVKSRWGHILVDDIRFADEPRPSEKAGLPRE